MREEAIPSKVECIPWIVNVQQSPHAVV